MVREESNCCLIVDCRRETSSIYPFPNQTELPSSTLCYSNYGASCHEHIHALSKAITSRHCILAQEGRRRRLGVC